MRRLAASIAAGEYPDESPYIPVPLAELDQLVENLPLSVGWVLRISTRA